MAKPRPSRNCAATCLKRSGWRRSAIAVRVNLEPAEYAKQLADEKKSLELLAGDDESVTASITLSYNLLDAETQKRWRMLAVFPDTFDALAAAAVWEIELDAAQDTLSRLLQFSMLEWNDSTKRYRLHDLMRAFARERIKFGRIRRAAAHAPCQTLSQRDPQTPTICTRGGESLMRGLALFDLERGNIQAGQTWAADRAAKEPEARSCAIAIRECDPPLLCDNIPWDRLGGARQP